MDAALQGNTEGDATEVAGITNVDGIYASKNIKMGDVVLTEDELPDCSLARFIHTCWCFRRNNMLICSDDYM